MKALIYIAGPLSAPTEKERLENIQRAIDAGLEVYRAGGIPFIPHLNHWAGLRSEANGPALEYPDFLAWDLPVLRRCDGLVRLPGQSTGASIEEAAAREFGLPVFKMSSLLGPGPLRDWIAGLRIAEITRGED